MAIDRTKPYIVGIGGANIDIHAKLDSKAIPADSNPAVISTSLGGVTRNILDNLARQEEQCILLSSVGDDSFGKNVIFECEKLRIDCSRVLVCSEYGTGSYLAIIEPNGNLAIASCDARVIENIPLSYFDENKDVLESASAIVCDPNLTTSQLLKIREVSGDVKIFIDPTSVTKAARIKDILDMFYFVKPNRLELEALSGITCDSDENIEKAVDVLLSKGVSCVAVTLGGRGCFYKDSFGKRMFRCLEEKVVAIDETGAGDAFMSGMVYGFVNGYEVEKMIDVALYCAALTVASSSSISNDMSKGKIEEFLEKR